MLSGYIKKYLMIFIYCYISIRKIIINVRVIYFISELKNSDILVSLLLKNCIFLFSLSRSAKLHILMISPIAVANQIHRLLIDSMQVIIDTN